MDAYNQPIRPIEWWQYGIVPLLGAVLRIGWIPKSRSPPGRDDVTKPPPFRLTAPIPKERDIHETCASALDTLLLPPALWFCYPAGLVELSAAQMSRYVRSGLKSGLPDIWVLYRGVWLIELKRPGGVLSENRLVRTKHGWRAVTGQVERFEQLAKTGAVRDLAVCYSVDEMLDQLEAWEIPMRRRIVAA